MFKYIDFKIIIWYGFIQNDEFYVSLHAIIRI
jgi:hypothetical protein